jgi:hypothetical protein
LFCCFCFRCIKMEVFNNIPLHRIQAYLSLQLVTHYQRVQTFYNASLQAYFEAANILFLLRSSPMNVLSDWKLCVEWGSMQSMVMGHSLDKTIRSRFLAWLKCPSKNEEYGIWCRWFSDRNKHLKSIHKNFRTDPTFCNNHSNFFFGTTQLIKIAPSLALIELENSFWAHLKANKMPSPMRYHKLRFNLDQHQGHQS